MKNYQNNRVERNKHVNEKQSLNKKPLNQFMEETSLLNTKPYLTGHIDSVQEGKKPYNCKKNQFFNMQYVCVILKFGNAKSCSS